VGEKKRHDKWDKYSAAASITRNGGLVDVGRKQLWCPPTVGIKVLGAIDYLVNHQKFARVLDNKSLTKNLKKGRKNKSFHKDNSPQTVVKIMRKKKPYKKEKE
jgi:hypothetical protein